MTTSDAYKKIVIDLINVVWTQGNLDALPSFWTDNCINHADPSAEKVGLTALRRYHAEYSQTFTSFSEVSIAVPQQVGEGDRVVTQIRTTAKHTGPFMGMAPTGRVVELATIRIDRFVEDKIAEHWSVADMAGLLMQISAR